ncbi:MAG: conjugal transfer protein TraC [Acidobacteriota bacterium]|nr:conjugal transfer protein TraC [Acidobacteriota bacterium]
MALDLITLLVGTTLASAAAWKTGFADSLAGWLGSRAERVGAWVTSEDGTWASLPEQLPYRDFYADVIETRDGWLWTGLELRPVSTEGFSGRDWNLAGARLNRVIAGLPDHTWVQVITLISDRADDACAVFERLATLSPDSVMQTLARSRADHLRREAASGRVRDSRTLAFIGRKPPPSILRVPFRGVWSSRPFIELERAEFLQLRDDVLRARDTFAAALKAAGGASRPVSARVAFDLAYARLNPERAAFHAAPDYVPPHVTGVCSADSMFDMPRQGTCRSASLFESFPSAAQISLPNVSDFAARAMIPAIEQSALREELFAENPRETLCFTDVEVKEDYFLLGSLPCTTVSLQRLPKKVFAGLMEVLTRSAGLDFPF